MADPVAGFYDRLAPDYSLIFPDWRRSISHQAEVLDALISRYTGAPSPMPRVLDCSCGIGTQAIGLALKGYNVHGTDISPEAVKRAEAEVRALNASATFGVADFRYLDTQVQGEFDVVLSCDNSLPHLLAESDLLLAARAMKAKLRPGGLLLVGIRDYDKALLERPSVDTPRVFDGPEGKRVVLQVWDWEPDRPVYVLNHFILKQVEGEWALAANRTKYRAWQRSELSAALAQAGFADIEWRMPEETGYYQPIVTALAPAG